MKKQGFDRNCDSTNLGVKEVAKENEDVIDLVYIIDKSGSMSGLEKDTIGSFNSGLKKQREEEGVALVTTALFSNEYDLIHNRVNLNAVKDLDEKTYQVGGCTALLDAIGKTINILSNENKNLITKYVPKKAIVVIITDGLENASKEYSKDKIKKMIEAKKEEGWEFIFLGANFDAINVARDISINPDYAAEFICDEHGLEVQSVGLNKAIKAFRKYGEVNANWKEEIEKDTIKRK